MGQKHLTLESGDSIFVNSNILHGIRQPSGNVPDPVPNIVFSDVVIASGNNAIYQKYIRSIASSDALPYIVFRHGNSWHNEVNQLAEDIYCQMQECGACQNGLHREKAEGRDNRPLTYTNVIICVYIIFPINSLSNLITVSRFSSSLYISDSKNFPPQKFFKYPFFNSIAINAG